MHDHDTRIAPSDANRILELDSPSSAGTAMPPGSLSSRQMADAARALLDGLDPMTRARLSFPSLGDSARTWWSNLPAHAVARPGVAMRELGDTQRALVHEFLRASTSSQGYLKITGIMQLDDIWRDQVQRDVFGSGHYFVAIFGDPADEHWAWLLTGHHLGATFTVAGERAGFTPLFLGAQPYEVAGGPYAGWRPLPHEVTRGHELVRALADNQRRLVVLSQEVPGDVLAGPGRRDRLGSFEGLPARVLDGGQQRLLWTLIQEYVRNADVDAADAQLAVIRATWAETHFAWHGPTDDPAARFYYRVHGPRILIEYDRQATAPGVLGGHIHTITRDPTNDYGEDWLGLHYQEAHQ